MFSMELLFHEIFLENFWPSHILNQYSSTGVWRNQSAGWIFVIGGSI